MDGGGVDVDSEKHVTPAAKAVEPGCPICLESFEDKAFVDVCFHTFCFACILQWADVVSSCPMCKVPFKSIIHNVRGVDSYDQHEIKPKPVLVSQEVSLAEARRFWYRTTRLSSSTRKGQKDGPSSKRSVSHRRNIAAQKRRKAIYSANLWVKPLPAEQGVKKVRVTNAKFYKSNPAATHRLMPWLTREFKVIVGEENTSFMIALVNSMLNKHDITSPEFAENLKPFLFEKTEHFVHEFVSFAQSPYDMVAYDDKAEYDVPADGTDLPQLLPVDEEEPGPSGISSSQQKVLDNIDDGGNHKFNSPTMKQCRGEDDTSGSDSHDDEELENRRKIKKTGDDKGRSRHERTRSGSYTRAHSRDHSRDYGDKRHRDDAYSRSRKMHADHYDNRDRYSSRSRHGDRSHRRHSHHHRRHHSYSSDSSNERHSYKRRKRSSSAERDRHKSRRKEKKSKSDRRQRSRSPGRKKKRRHHHSSNSNSPISNRDDSKKSVELTRSLSDDKDEILKQAPDEVLQEELVSLQSQITMDKKMLLKNLLRKERLELLHESLEKEQVVDEAMINSDDNKLKEELQQLDEAIATGKTALVKVMKRIGSTESERNTSEQ